MATPMASDFSHRRWLGFTDKYWATAIIPAQDETINARFFHTPLAGNGNDYRANFVSQAAVAIPAGATAEHTSLAFAGAKVESIIDSYERAHGIDRFELLIDWGWFHFITKPMFYISGCFTSSWQFRSSLR